MLGVRKAWQTHPLIQFERARLQRKWWWPGRVVGWAIAALIGASLGCALAPLITDVSGVGIAALIAAVPGVCILGTIASVLRVAVVWIVPALTARSFAHERELGTLDILRATPLSSRSLAFGKWMVALLKLGPALLALAALTPFQSAWMTGNAGLTVVVQTLDPILEMNVGRFWVGFLTLAVLSALKPWSALALNSTVGLCVSALCRSYKTALAATYGTIVLLRAGMGFLSFFSTLPAAVLAPPTAFDLHLVMPDVLSTTFALIVELIGSVLLFWATVWRLERG